MCQAKADYHSMVLIREKLKLLLDQIYPYFIMLASTLIPYRHIILYNISSAVHACTVIKKQLHSDRSFNLFLLLSSGCVC